jgi:hypothetical protein
MPPRIPVAIPAAPPASDRMVGRRMGFLLVEIASTVRGQLPPVGDVSATEVLNQS